MISIVTLMAVLLMIIATVNKELRTVYYLHSFNEFLHS